MTLRRREPLRPEDATSLEEFQARRIAEQAQIRALNSSWKTIGQILLSSLLVFVSIFFWFGFATEHGGAKWVNLVIALLITGLVVRIFGRIELRAARGSARYMQLTRLSRDWQARARRGEISQTTPGGPTVWRDDVEAASHG